LRRLYENHHERKCRYGFSYYERERGYIFSRWIGKGKKILDLGCRDGYLTRYYVEGNSVIGVDIDKRALRKCSETLGIEVMWLDINEGLPFSSNSFDVVVVGEVLEHVFSPDNLLKEIRRVLTSNGMLIGSTPNAFHFKNRIRFLIGMPPDTFVDETHIHHFSLRDIKSLLGRYFNDVTIIGIGGGGCFRKSLIRVAPDLFAPDIAWKCVGLRF